jgi:hypothetical protein
VRLSSFAQYDRADLTWIGVMKIGTTNPKKSGDRLMVVNEIRKDEYISNLVATYLSPEPQPFRAYFDN